MTWRLSRIARLYYWPYGGNRAISWYFWCDRTQAGESWASKGKYHRFSTFREACKAQAAMRLELEQASQPEGAAQ